MSFRRRVKPVSFEAYRGHAVLPLKLFRALRGGARWFTLRFVNAALYEVVVTVLTVVFVGRHLLIL